METYYTLVRVMFFKSLVDHWATRFTTW